MQYMSKYKSPIGEITLAADDQELTGLWFVGQKYYALCLDSENEEKEIPILKETKKWLEVYFSGREPNFKLQLHFTGTQFQNEVWEILYSIPYGKTMTYGEIARILANKKGLKKMSAQAVGGAVGKNPISIIIPCHRVVGSSGKLIGYAGGIRRKQYLLEHEQVNISQGRVHMVMENNIRKRCKWVNLNNPLYIKYHDTEWGIPHYDDSYMFEFLVLESFQAGLSWECVLNKREAFREAFDNFDYNKISNYSNKKIDELCNNRDIIRNKLKIESTINNAKIFIEIQGEFGSFSNYIWSFTHNKVIKNMDNNFRATSVLSDTISADLKKRGMKFVSSTIIYSYLQAIGIINDHELECDFNIVR